MTPDSAITNVAEVILRPRNLMRADACMTLMSPTDYRVKVLRSDGDKQDVLVLVDDASWKLLQAAWATANR